MMNCYLSVVDAMMESQPMRCEVWLELGLLVQWAQTWGATWPLMMAMAALGQRQLEEPDEEVVEVELAWMVWLAEHAGMGLVDGQMEMELRTKKLVEALVAWGVTRGVVIG